MVVINNLHCIPHRYAEMLKGRDWEKFGINEKELRIEKVLQVERNKQEM